ncbi:MAG: inositol monophosphatase [Oligoflexia bacterium]|nr:inositol monophosphatase [Oligoflexia bacterium]
MPSRRPPLDSLIQAAVTAAQASGRVLLRNFGTPLRVGEKEGAGLVTNVDLESEEAALRILKRKFPGFGILSEEAGVEQARIPGRWIIDPLDGTTNYVHRFPMFCVSIAAEWEGEIVAGVIYHPILKDTYVAGLGKGARLNGKKIRVSKTPRLESSLLTTGFTYRKDEWLHAEMEAFERLSGIARAVRRPGSAALDLAYTARGVFDGFWEKRLSPWDVAAGALLVQEAGGKVTDFHGKPFRVQGREIVASNAILHEELLSRVKPAVSRG